MRKSLIFPVFLVTAALGACSGGGGSGSPSSGSPGSGGSGSGSGSSGNPPPATPPNPPPSLPPVGTLTCSPCKKIVFMSDRDGDDEIFSINADGTALTRLTDNDSYDGAPAWSPDGQRIAFTSDRDFDAGGSAGSRNELYVMDADGSDVTRLTFSTGGAGRPTWSPDGTRIVYEGGINGLAGLLEIPASGGSPTLLFSTPGIDSHPAWSPDGTRLALVSDWYAYDSVTDIFLINADGSGFTAVTDGNIFDQLNYEDPAWSPDGIRIALTVSKRLGTDEYATHIGLASANGSTITSLPAPTGTSLDGVSAGNPSWSPDGTTIAYTACANGRCDVSWMKVDGSLRGTIITNGRAPDWQR